MNDSKVETSVIKCKHCNNTCVRIYAGRYKNGKDRRWVDENGKEFSGKVCPSCHIERCAINMRLKRNRVLRRNR